MPNKNYIRGVAFERFLQHRMEGSGYEVFRTAGSHGSYDLIAIDRKNHDIVLVQCKTKVGKYEPIIKEETLEPGTPSWFVVGIKKTKYIRGRKK